MRLQGASFAIGQKSKLKVVKGVSTGAYGSFKTESLRLDEPLVEDFMAACDYQSFKRFCKRYGLIMLKPLISGVTVKRSNLQGAYRTFDGREAVVSESELAELWTAIERRIKARQDDVRRLQKEQESDPDRFIKHLNAGLKSARLKAARLRARGGADYGLVSHGADLKSAMYLQVILAGAPLVSCGGCGRVFLNLNNRQDRLYCSDSCRERAKVKRRQDNKSKLDYRKEQTRARLNRLWMKDPEAAKAMDEEVRAELREARSLKAVDKIEERYGLEKQTAGRRPASSTGDKLK